MKEKDNRLGFIKIRLRYCSRSKTQAVYWEKMVTEHKYIKRTGI